MLTALSTALSALNAQSVAIDVVGNNLANLNTTGYKSDSTQFFDLVSQTIGGGAATQIGMGVGTPLTKRVFSQGSIQSSSSALDVAIQGDGFLIVKDASNASLYTRAGNLKVDGNGVLTTATGQYVQGWSSVNGSLNTTAGIGNITVPVGSLKPAVATQNMSITANLDSTSTVVPPASQTASNASFSTAVQLFDSLGTSHLVTLNFWNNGANSWNWNATIPSGDVTNPAANSPIGSGTLTFNGNGILTTPATPKPQLNITRLSDSANDMTISLDWYKGTTPLITQFAQQSASSANSQDGSPSAQLTHVGLGDGGLVLAQYSDGQQTTVGQLAMANFVNPDSLLAVGNNNYQITGKTSNPTIGAAATGGRGQILGGSLESSTVDIATEFTSLMIDQRAYQANSKVITSADQISQDTINLIR
jgi:flagellar hook protein FlgE